MLAILADELQRPVFIWVALGTVLAGLTRGLTGFGSAMILVPVLSAAFGPVIAVPILQVVDSLVTLPLLPPAFRQCRWREVVPLALGSALLLPLGVYALVVADPGTLRWVTSGVILLVVAAIVGGWRYQGQPGPSLSLGVGGLAGVMGGSTGLSGPPVILFWLGSQAHAPLVRANVIAFFGVNTIMVVATMGWAGLFTAQVLALSALLVPIYALAVWLGARGAGLAPEQVLRRLMLLLVAAVAVASLFG